MGGKGRDRVISQRPDGQWANKRNDADKASSLHKTQREAIDAARECSSTKAVEN